MNYRIVLKCQSESDAKKYDRDLRMNHFETAESTFKSMVRGALEDLISPYIIEFYYGEQLSYKLEKL